MTGSHLLYHTLVPARTPSGRRGHGRDLSGAFRFSLGKNSSHFRSFPKGDVSRRRRPPTPEGPTSQSPELR